jgi:hypothetical protein
LLVKAERTGWRDLELSQRHRRWGWDCPAVDLDFLFLEYDRGKAVALVEYKHENAAPQYRTHPTYQALIDLGNRAEVPVFGARYASDFSWWRITPLNNKAKEWIAGQETMSEKEWVTFLYKIRGYDLPEDVFVDNKLAL